MFELIIHTIYASRIIIRKDDLNESEGGCRLLFKMKHLFWYNINGYAVS